MCVCVCVCERALVCLCVCVCVCLPNDGNVCSGTPTALKDRRKDACSVLSISLVGLLGDKKSDGAASAWHKRRMTAHNKSKKLLCTTHLVLYLNTKKIMSMTDEKGKNEASE